MGWTRQGGKSQAEHVSEMGEMHLGLQDEMGWFGLALPGNA